MIMNPFSIEFCPVCHSQNLLEVIKITNIPVYCNVLFDSQQEAEKSKRGNIHLYYCKTCQHFFNRDFNPELLDYSVSYENSLHFSPHFQEYATDLASYLINKYNLRGKDIIDVGCGKGDFLKLICELGDNRGYGFDKSFEPENLSHSPDNSVSFIQDFFSEKYSDYPADMLLCRHVLEHVDNPNEFLKMIRDSLSRNSDTHLYFEVPNVMYTIEQSGIWDLIYEHVSYFSAFSLKELFYLNHFQIQAVKEQYDGQFLGIEASIVIDNKQNQHHFAPDDLVIINDLVIKFEKLFKEKVSSFQNKLDQLFQQGKKTVIWGGGSKGVTMANLLNTKVKIDYIVDLNPRKQGKFVAGTGNQIISPDFLKSYKPDWIILMNPVYANEVKKIVNELGLKAEYLYA
ncbi:MAG: methyltransferase domain-containing protein [Calditrichaeota bacterium]|nr:methyltransferase domain-containing protein [Calditrichota bacterium]